MGRPTRQKPSAQTWDVSSPLTLLVKEPNLMPMEWEVYHYYKEDPGTERKPIILNRSTVYHWACLIKSAQ